MVEMSCEDHDRIAASTQFMTHTVGRILGSMDLGSTAIDTKGFQSLLSLVDNTTHDSFDLYYGLFMYNAVRPQMPTLENNRSLATRCHTDMTCLCLIDPDAVVGHIATGPEYLTYACNKHCRMQYEGEAREAQLDAGCHHGRRLRGVW